MHSLLPGEPKAVRLKPHDLILRLYEKRRLISDLVKQREAVSVILDAGPAKMLIIATIDNWLVAFREEADALIGLLS